MLTRASESSLGEPAMPPVGRRNRWRLLAGVLVVLASVAGFVAFNTVAADTTPVLVVARPVPMGQPLTRADVRVVDVRLAPGVEAVPAGEVDLVLGRPAAVPLSAGVLLTREQVGPAAVPRSGEVLVAVSVPLPPPGLAAGARVRVLVGPAGGAAGAAASGDGGLGALLASATATVAEVGPVDGTGGRVVALLLVSADGERVVTAAMRGQVSLVLEAGAG
jgi:Flp pilus assembly protein CpaB